MQKQAEVIAEVLEKNINKSNKDFIIKVSDLSDIDSKIVVSAFKILDKKKIGKFKLNRLEIKRSCGGNCKCDGKCGDNCKCKIDLNNNNDYNFALNILDDYIYLNTNEKTNKTIKQSLMDLECLSDSLLNEEDLVKIEHDLLLFGFVKIP